MCPMCKSEYKKPVTLPCGDTVCKYCIHKFSEKKTFKCESCVKYFNLKYLDFSVNKNLQLLIPFHKSLIKTQAENEFQIKSLNQELKDLKSTFSLKLKSNEQELTDLKFLLVSSNSQIDLQKTEISRLNSLLLSSNARLAELESVQKGQQIEFETEKNKLDLKKMTLNDLQQNLVNEQTRLVDTEKKLESKIKETIEFCNEKHHELNIRFREIELKELICNKKEKKRMQTEQLCGELSKELEIVLKARKFNRNGENEELRVRSELRPVKVSKLGSSLRHKSTRSSVASGL